MRILMLNPNTTVAVTERLATVGAQVASPGTEIVPLTATRGVPYIATRAEAQIGGAIALEMLAEHHTRVDAAIIAAFGDPGLHGAREPAGALAAGRATSRSSRAYRNRRGGGCRRSRRSTCP